MLIETEASPELRPYVDRLIYFRDFSPPSPEERLVPCANLFLVIELDGMTRRVAEGLGDAPAREVRGGWISGIQRRYRTISALPASEMMVVRFAPLGAARFLPPPLSDYEDRMTPAEELFPEGFPGLRDRLVSPGSAEAKIHIMETWLDSVRRPDFPRERELGKALAAIRRDPSLGIAELIPDYPGSHRRFIADFRSYVGTTPKFYQRILRFESLLESIEQKESVDWSDLAYRWGFSDQAHLVREFCYFSGFLPTEFLAREFQKDGTNFFPLVKNLQDGGVDP